jgi:hypothetical protein
MRVLPVLSGAAAIFLAGNSWLRYRAKRLARSRSGTGFDDFAAYFSAEQIPQDKLRVVYEYLQDWQSVKDFPVHATDDLYKVYGICDEDLDDAVVELAAKWSVVLPADVGGIAPLHTVADLVHLLARLPYGRNDTPV